MAREFVCSYTTPIVKTTAGRIRGYRIDSTYTFHGIKYANAKRFQMPTPPEPWEGVRDALSYGYVSPMLNRAGSGSTAEGFRIVLPLNRSPTMVKIFPNLAMLLS